MPRPPFSSKYRLWGDWLKNANPNSSYTKKIIRLHKIFPDRNLKFLQSLKISDVDLSSKPVSALTDKEFSERANSLKVLKIMRSEGLSLSRSIEKARELGFNPSEKSVFKHLGRTLYKSGNVWKARKTDKIQVRMGIYSNGKEETILVTNSKDRSLIGKYFNDVKKHNRGELDEKTFKKLYGQKTIVDAHGRKWKLETDLEEIKKIRTANPGDIFRVLYSLR